MQEQLTTQCVNQQAALTHYLAVRLVMAGALSCISYGSSVFALFEVQCYHHSFQQDHVRDLWKHWMLAYVDKSAQSFEAMMPF